MKLSSLLLALAVGHCLGAPLQYAEVNGGGSVFTDGPTTGSASIPLTLLGSGAATGAGYALATPGSLHASMAGMATNAAFGGLALASTEGTVTFACSGACGPTTTVSLNIQIDGSAGQTSGFAYVTVAGDLDGNPFYFTQHAGVIAGIPFGPDFSLVNYIHTTPTFTVPVNVPVPLVLNLQARASAYSSTSATATAFADFAHTVQLSTLGPVFNLPAGYTANSTDLNIVNNQFSPVPEPATWATLGAALMLLGWHRRGDYHG